MSHPLRTLYIVRLPWIAYITHTLLAAIYRCCILMQTFPAKKQGACSHL
jgi:hypothetical protein